MTETQKGDATKCSISGLLTGSTLECTVCLKVIKVAVKTNKDSAVCHPCSNIENRDSAKPCPICTSNERLQKAEFPLCASGRSATEWWLVQTEMPISGGTWEQTVTRKSMWLWRWLLLNFVLLSLKLPRSINKHVVHIGFFFYLLFLRRTYTSTTRHATAHSWVAISFRCRGKNS